MYSRQRQIVFEHCIDLVWAKCEVMLNGTYTHHYGHQHRSEKTNVLSQTSHQKCIKHTTEGLRQYPVVLRDANKSY
jgi:hypothetical protein